MQLRRHKSDVWTGSASINLAAIIGLDGSRDRTLYCFLCCRRQGIPSNHRTPARIFHGLNLYPRQCSSCDSRDHRSFQEKPFSFVPGKPGDGKRSGGMGKAPRRGALPRFCRRSLLFLNVWDHSAAEETLARSRARVSGSVHTQDAVAIASTIGTLSPPFMPCAATNMLTTMGAKNCTPRAQL